MHTIAHTIARGNPSGVGLPPPPVLFGIMGAIPTTLRADRFESEPVSLRFLLDDDISYHVAEGPWRGLAALVDGEGK